MPKEIKPDLAQHSAYTVIGLTDMGAPIAEVVEVETAAEAEHLVSERFACIAGVLPGALAVDPSEVHESPRPYTVVAYYRENEQRYAGSAEACSAGEAEELVVRQCNEDNNPGADEEDFDAEIIVICGVVEGEHQCADVYDEGEGGSIWRRPTDEDEDYERRRRGLPLKQPPPELGPIAAPGPLSRHSSLAERNGPGSGRRAQ